MCIETTQEATSLLFDVTQKCPGNVAAGLEAGQLRSLLKSSRMLEVDMDTVCALGTDAEGVVVGATAAHKLIKDGMQTAQLLHEKIEVIKTYVRLSVKREQPNVP